MHLMHLIAISPFNLISANEKILFFLNSALTNPGLASSCAHLLVLVSLLQLLELASCAFSIE
jgi:hypothetical protein